MPTVTSRAVVSARGVAGCIAMFISLAVGNASAEPLIQGPSSSATPYLRSYLDPQVSITSILTVGDSVNNKPDGSPYRMVGIPDGMGAFDNGNGTFTVLMNHELGPTQGITRAHGSTGAFVSQWVIDKSSLQVLSGQDLVQTVFTGGQSGVYTQATTQFARLCSADLPAVSAFYNASTGLGYNGGRIFMNGEETGAEGRAFAHFASGALAGQSYELPYLGKFSWENSVARTAASNKTVVIGTDDSTPGQVYVYVGNKQTLQGTGAAGAVTGTDALRAAGLIGGNLFGITVPGVAAESRSTGVGAVKNGPGVAFSLANLGDVSGKTGAQLQTDSTAAGVTEFLRPEDGAWDTQNPDRFYFVTTDRFDTEARPGTAPTKNTPASQSGRSRLWSMTFTFDGDGNPTGGTLDMLLDGTEGHQMLDNMTVDANGNVILQEDPGGQAYSARIWMYDPLTKKMYELASHDQDRFGNDLGQLPTAPYNNDEESSGVIDVTSILGGDGRSYYLVDVQAHYNISGELVQGGQLLLLAVDEPAGFGFTALALALGAVRLRRRRA